MKLILTVDDKNGLGFNKRRQSRDSALTADILAVVGDEKLALSPYSAPLFEGAGNLTVSETPLLDAEDGFCFLEAQTVDIGCADTLYLYRWGRVYPADVRLPKVTGMKKIAERAFPGSSHEKITLEVFEK